MNVPKQHTASGGAGIPPLAGLCTLQQAQNPGLDVEAAVARLKRLHYALKRLHEICNARITAEPIYELKMALGRHAYMYAEHATALRRRVGEMREPPLGLEAVPHEGLRIFFDEILSSPTTAELLLGLFAHALPAVTAACQQYMTDAHPLADAPSVRLMRFALLELNDMAAFGNQALTAVVEDATEYAAWSALLEQCLDAAGGVSGTGERRQTLPSPHYSAEPYQYDRVPQRDARFVDPYNGGVDPETFLYDQQFSARDKTLMMYYKRLREIDVPEMMASILVETPGQPWEYYLEMSRQVWDECRHAMMGEVGFASLGIDWTSLPINFTWSLNLNTQLTPSERHAVLFFIEQSLMTKTGKRYEWEVARESGVGLARVFQDFDWADEVLHAAIGRRWFVKNFRDHQASLDHGEACWNLVMNRWSQYREQGLTTHRNWWPDLYRAACSHWGVTPDPAALAFAASYEQVDDLRGHLGAE